MKHICYHYCKSMLIYFYVSFSVLQKYNRCTNKHPKQLFNLAALRKCQNTSQDTKRVQHKCTLYGLLRLYIITFLNYKTTFLKIHY